MRKLITTLRTENMSQAEVEAVSDLHVVLKIAQTDQWNAEGLLKLAAMLKGMAHALDA